jgi:Tol biopolymer transport system component
MNANGTGERPLTSGKSPWNHFAWHPAWSPDGSKIAFASDRDYPNSQIYSMNAADGSGVTRLTYNTNVNDYPAWSPDGSKIAFDSNSYLNHYEICYMNADGTDQHQISNNISTNWMPAWSPDGSKILFLSDRFMNARIFVMNADGSDQTDLSGSKQLVHDERPSWSPDGSKILFARSGVLKAQDDICVMNPDGSDATCLTLSAPDNLDPDWQPITSTLTSGTYTATVTVLQSSTFSTTETVAVTRTFTEAQASLLLPYLGLLVIIAVLVISIVIWMRPRRVD